MADLEKKNTDQTEVQEVKDYILSHMLKSAETNSKRWFTVAMVLLFMLMATIGGIVGTGVWFFNNYDLSTVEMSTDGGGDANYIGNDGDINGKD